MKKNILLSLVLVTSIAQSILSSDKQNSDKQNNEASEFFQTEEEGSTFSRIGDTFTQASYKIVRKVQKTTGLVNVAFESEEDCKNRLENFAEIDSLEKLSMDAKQGGLFSQKPSCFKQVNDRIHSNFVQAQTTLVKMFDTKSLDVNLLNSGKQNIDNGIAYSLAMHKSLLDRYNEKFDEIQNNIKPKNNLYNVEESANGKDDK